MRKLLLLAIASTFSAGAWADISCDYLSKVADSNYTELDALELLKVNGGNGDRLYFHSAPSVKCKINQTFVIPKDTVLAYYLFNNEGKEWVYIVYTNKNNVKTSGWVLRKNLSFLKTIALDG